MRSLTPLVPRESALGLPERYETGQHHRNRFWVSLTGLVLLSIGQVACDRSNSKHGRTATTGSTEAASIDTVAPSASVPPAEKAGDSPVEVFLRLKNAYNSRDFETYFRMFTREAQDPVLAGVFIGTAVMASSSGVLNAAPAFQKQFQEVVTRHGLEHLDHADGGNRPLAAVTAALDKVENRPRLYAELWTLMIQDLKRRDGKVLRARLVRIEEVENLQVDGDNATGVVVLKYDNGETVREPITFHRVDGHWLVRSFGIGAHNDRRCVVTSTGCEPVQRPANTTD